MVSLVDNLSGNKTHDSNDNNDDDLGVDMYSSDPNKKEPALTTEKDEDSDEDSGQDDQVKMLANNNEHVTSTVKYELGDKSNTLPHQQVNRELSGMDKGLGDNKEGTTKAGLDEDYKELMDEFNDLAKKEKQAEKSKQGKLLGN